MPRVCSVKNKLQVVASSAGRGIMTWQGAHATNAQVAKAAAGEERLHHGRLRRHPRVHEVPRDVCTWSEHQRVYTGHK